MEALGRQILVEFYDCSVDKVNDVEYIEMAMVKAVQASEATIVSQDFHQFTPHGVSGAVLIAESHVSIHTWPEYAYAAVDIFTCGDMIDPWIIQEKLKCGLESENESSMELKRGMFKEKKDRQLRYKPTGLRHE